MSISIAFFRFSFENTVRNLKTEISSDTQMLKINSVESETIFEKVIKSFKDDCVEQQLPIIINKDEEDFILAKYKVEWISKKDKESYFGRMFYGKLLERDKLAIKDGKEIELKGGRDFDEDEFYFAIFEAPNKEKKNFKSVYLLLQMTGNTGIKTGVIDNVYSKKINNFLKDFNNSSGNKYRVNVKSFNIGNIQDFFKDSTVKEINVYFNKNFSFPLKAKVEEKFSREKLIYDTKFSVKGLNHKLKQTAMDFFEIDLDPEEIEEVDFQIETSNGKTRTLKRKTRDEEITNIQARFDVTDLFEKSTNDEEIYKIFKDLFEEIVRC